MSEYMQIDGSRLEGGGQIIRTASALSVMTQKPARIFNIRSKRPQPGLRTQHLRGLEAIAGLCDARLEGAKMGSKEVWFYPSAISKKEIEITLDTAASTGLVLQSLLIASLKAKGKLTINIDGGSTFSKWAPPLQYIQFVLLPQLRRMGHHVEINILNHGFYPTGGARVKVMISPGEGLKPLKLEERGEIETVDIVSVSSSRLKKPRVAERQSRFVLDALEGKGYECNVKNRYDETSCPGSGLLLVARTDTGCILGSDGLGERGKPAEVVAEDAVNALLKTIKSGATVDEHMSDQIMPYMAICEKGSSITAPSLTTHAKTNMWVINEMLGIELSTEKKGGTVTISR